MIRTSKFLSLVLRHKPEAIGLTLDGNGWALVTDLIDKAKPRIQLTPGLIEQVVIDNDKQRFALSEDRTQIRANQGHSVKVDLQLTPREPPATLYHGTASRFIEVIMAEGLDRRKRQHVHLSATIETAIAVGQRHGKPVVLSVTADTMHEQGYEFYLSENKVWLTAAVPPRFLSPIE